jgi:hypothetical protein
MAYRVAGLVVLSALALMATACGNSAPSKSNASVTVELPPAKPYNPQPAFSFGSAPRSPH